MLRKKIPDRSRSCQDPGQWTKSGNVVWPFSCHRAFHHMHTQWITSQRKYTNGKYLNELLVCNWVWTAVPVPKTWHQDWSFNQEGGKNQHLFKQSDSHHQTPNSSWKVMTHILDLSSWWGAAHFVPGRWLSYALTDTERNLERGIVMYILRFSNLHVKNMLNFEKLLEIVLRGGEFPPHFRFWILKI